MADEIRPVPSYEERVNAFKLAFEVVGPCPKCEGSGVFKWISNAAETRGMHMDGACKRCNGKGFMTNRDVENNASFEAWAANRDAQAIASMERRGIKVVASNAVVSVATETKATEGVPF